LKRSTHLYRRDLRMPLQRHVWQCPNPECDGFDVVQFRGIDPESAKLIPPDPDEMLIRTWYR
jgi:hypothetical protein